MNKPLNQDSNPQGDVSKDVDLELTEQQEAELKRKLEELRRRDPFIYR
jgi:hypothetical protein